MSRILKLSTVGVFLALSAASFEANAQTIDAQTVPPEGQKDAPRRGFSWSADLGFSIRRLYSVPIYSGEFELSFGGALKAVAIYGTAGVMLGQTSEGLLTSRVSLGPTLLFPVSDRVRLGLTPRFSFLGIQRVTSNESLGGASFGFHGIVTVDIASMDPGKLYAGLRLGADYFPNSLPEAWLWGGTLDLGFRY